MTTPGALHPHDLLDTEDLAALLGVRPSSLSVMRTQASRHRSIDGMPEPLRLVSHRPVWLRADVEAWLVSTSSTPKPKRKARRVPQAPEAEAPQAPEDLQGPFWTR